MSEKPLLDLTGERFAAMSDEQRSKALFGGKFRLTGSLSKWASEHPEAYARARALAQETGALGESPAERAARHRREAVMTPQPAAPPAGAPPEKKQRVPPPPVVIDERIAQHVGISRGPDGKFSASWEDWQKYHQIVAATQP